MTPETIVTTIIPLLLVGCLVYYNLRKIKRNLNQMKEDNQQKNNSCGGSCAGCKGCGSATTPTADPEKEKEE